MAVAMGPRSFQLSLCGSFGASVTVRSTGTTRGAPTAPETAPQTK